MDPSEVSVPEAAPDRRSRLRQLDRLLEVLEVLNLYEREVPGPVRKRLEIEGIACRPGGPISELIDQVLELQHPYLLRIRGHRWDLANNEDLTDS